MPSAESLFILGGCTLIALAMLSAVFAWSWKEWLDLRRHQLDRDMPSVAGMIDLADLRERIRKLEAIAAGVDL